MFGLSNEDGILVVLMFDIFLSFALGAFVDRGQSDYPVEYREYVGFFCAAPLLFVVNMLGVVILLVLNAINFLGPWWTWILGIGAPYVIAVVVLWKGGQPETKSQP
jgi:hypothetical protein